MSFSMMHRKLARHVSLLLARKKKAQHQNGSQISTHQPNQEATTTEKKTSSNYAWNHDEQP
jgi:hypothetical protein